MTAAPAIADLRDAAATLRRANDPGHHQVAGLLDALAAGRAEVRAVVLPGQRSPETVARLGERDRIIREAAAAPDLAGLPPTEQARRLRSGMRRYEAAGWRAFSGDRDRAECPLPAGTIAAAGWAVLRLGLPVPSERHIRRILATS